MQKDQLLDLIDFGVRMLMLGKSMYKPELMADVQKMVDVVRKPEVLGPLTELVGPKLNDVLGVIDHVLTMERGIFEKARAAQCAKCDELIATLNRLKNKPLALNAICFTI
jgi:hypothetical protein